MTGCTLLRKESLAQNEPAMPKHTQQHMLTNRDAHALIPRQPYRNDTLDAPPPLASHVRWGSSIQSPSGSGFYAELNQFRVVPSPNLLSRSHDFGFSHTCMHSKIPSAMQIEAHKSWADTLSVDAHAYFRAPAMLATPKGCRHPPADVPDKREGGGRGGRFVC